MTILATFREPFGLCPRVAYLPEGETLEQMRNRMVALPNGFDQHGVICVNGVAAPRALWGAIRPKPIAVTEITFHMPPRGGGEGGGKQILALVASIAITVIAGFATAGLFATSGGLFTAGSASAYLLAAGISLAGSLLLSALAPPPTAPDRKRGQRELGNASAEGNILEPNAPIPRVIGQRKIYPPLGAEPLTYFDGPDEIVEAAYILAGPHSIEDVRIGSAQIDELSGVQYQIIEGWRGSLPTYITTRQARTEALQAEIRGHLVSEDAGDELDVDTSDIANSVPQPQVVSTRTAPDEHQLQITFPQGLHKNADETNRLRVPFRLRMRMVGEADWIALPDLHFQAAEIKQMRSTIRFVWTDAPDEPSASATSGWVEARVRTEEQATAPAVPQWDASAYFYSGSGDRYLNNSNAGSTGVINVRLDRYTATIYLDPYDFPPGRYEIEIRRGCAFENLDYSASAYTYDGTVFDFFTYYGTPIAKIPFSRDGVADAVYLLRSVSIWNEHPLPSQDLAVIAVKARNKALDRLSCLAGGWVRDWDGSGWNDWVITDNPAPHLRDIYVGSENVDPVPLDLIDDDGLVAWRQACIDNGYTCNALIEDLTLDDAARIVASCGYAKPYMSDIWGVVRDFDRSYDDPVQLFTPRNMANFQWTKAFARLPDGFRVSFRDATRDYETSQISVFRAGLSDDNGRMEQVTYEGIVSDADAIARARYDLAQGVYRNTFYSFEVSAEHVLCRRGDLVAVQHDMISEWCGAARVTAIETDSSGDVTALALDTPVDIPGTYFMDESPDLSAEANLAALGLEGGVAIRRLGSISIHRVDGGDPYRLEFSPAISPDGIEVDGLIVAGTIGHEVLRLLVFSVTPRQNLEASITCVDEAPELWSA